MNTVIVFSKNSARDIARKIALKGFYNKVVKSIDVRGAYEVSAKCPLSLLNKISLEVERSNDNQKRQFFI